MSYLEGCTAPAFDKNTLHAAVVELSAAKNAEIKYSTVQNWCGSLRGLCAEAPAAGGSDKPVSSPPPAVASAPKAPVAGCCGGSEAGPAAGAICFSACGVPQGLEKGGDASKTCIGASSWQGHQVHHNSSPTNEKPPAERCTEHPLLEHILSSLQVRGRRGRQGRHLQLRHQARPVPRRELQDLLDAG